MSQFADNETVVLYPGFGHLVDEDRTWRVPVHGVVSRPGRPNLQQRILLKFLRQLMKAHPEALESEIFQRRIQGFVAVTEKGKQVDVRIGRHVYTLQKKTARTGHFSGSIRLPQEEVHALAEEGRLEGNALRYQVALPHGDERRFEGRVHLLDRTGVSVISDIDDTIKHTHVTCRRSLLTNTFLREFEPVPGMAQLYAKWAQQGAALHYVSSSPWQLYDPLSALLGNQGFPAGTFHLASFRLSDHLLRKVFLLRRRAKLAVIRSILQTFPERQFVLVGDSGERDPEIYGAVARKHPGQISAILIRDLAERPLPLRRSLKAFRDVPGDVWKLFRHPEELTGYLPSPMAELARV
jgi:phosphatidate phosphatase APP1